MAHGVQAKRRFDTTNTSNDPLERQKNLSFKKHLEEQKEVLSDTGEYESIEAIAPTIVVSEQDIKRDGDDIACIIVIENEQGDDLQFWLRPTFALALAEYECDLKLKTRYSANTEQNVHMFLTEDDYIIFKSDDNQFFGKIDKSTLEYKLSQA